MTDRATRATSGDTRDLIGCNSGRGAFKGKAGKPFLVTWSAAAAATGFLFDMQVRVSQDRSFDDSLVGQTATAATYVPETAGNYVKYQELYPEICRLAESSS